jgi:hypothetical protein
LFRNTIHADAGALEALDAEIQTLEAQPLAGELKALWEQAERQAEAEPARSRESFKKVQEVHGALVKRFPKSRQAVELRGADIEAARDTALSRRSVAALRSHEAKLADHLSKGRWKEAESELALCRAIGETLNRETPRSQDVTAAGLTKFEYLAVMWQEARKIRATVEEGLVPLGSAQVAVQPVTQELFSLVMSRSPSRSNLPSNPVTEITHPEAAEFCRRLGWLLGAPVRLPHVEEVQQLRSTTSLSKAVPQEWLQSPNASSFAMVAALRSDNAQPVSTRAALRSLDIGFRFVVEGLPKTIPVRETLGSRL